MMARPRIVYADPREVVREAVVSALRDGYDLDVVASVDSVDRALLQADRTRPDVVVIATTFGERLDQVCNGIRRLQVPRPRILVVDGRGSQDTLLAAIEAGADGYAIGAAGLLGLRDAVLALARGECVVPPHMLGPLLRRLIDRRREAAHAAAKLDRLTQREREVLRLLVDGLDQMAVAEELVVSPETVRTHIQRILRKLDVHSRLEAVALVGRTGSADRLEQMVTGRAS